MVATVADLYADVRDGLKRGTSQDANMFRWASRACEVLEKAMTYQYMVKDALVTVDPTSPTPERIGFPNPRVKSWNFIRIVTPGIGRDTRYTYLNSVTQRDVTELSTTVLPAGYWFDGVSAIVLDAVPQTALTFELNWNEYTDWPVDVTQTPEVLRENYNQLFGLMMLYGGRSIKDPAIMQTYAGFDIDPRGATVAAEAEKQFNGTRPRMQYAPPR